MQTQVSGAAEAYARLGSQFLLGAVVEYPGANDCDKDYAGFLVAGVTRPTPLASYNGPKGFSAMAERAKGFLNDISLPATVATDGAAAVEAIRHGKVPYLDYSGSMVVKGFGDSYEFVNN